MSVNVAGILEELRADHLNMIALMDVLEEEINYQSDRDNPDYTLMRDIMAYMTGYPDAVHHRKEDWLYSSMAALQPSMFRDLHRIESDHSELSGLGNKLLSDIRAADSGTVLRKLDVIDDASAFVKRLRDHMQWEDEKLFPVALSLKDDLEASEVPRFEADRVDPLFGVNPTDENRRLLARIEAGQRSRRR